MTTLAFLAGLATPFILYALGFIAVDRFNTWLESMIERWKG